MRFSCKSIIVLNKFKVLIVLMGKITINDV